MANPDFWVRRLRYDRSIDRTKLFPGLLEFAQLIAETLSKRNAHALIVQRNVRVVFQVDFRTFGRFFSAWSLSWRFFRFFDAQADTLLRSVDIKHFNLNFLAFFQYFLRCTDMLVGDLGDMNQTFNTWCQFNESSESNQTFNNACYNVARVELLASCFPRTWSGCFDTEADFSFSGSTLSTFTRT